MAQPPPAAPQYGFPGFMPTFDEDGARNFLCGEHNFPQGFASLIIDQAEKVAHRFFVRDHRINQSFNQYIDQ
jgi:hypothetical protein